MNTYLPSLAGGMLIGASAVMLLLLNGRIAGISGIVCRLAQRVDLTTNLAFVLGLLLGPLAYLSIFDGWPTEEITVRWPRFGTAGLLRHRPRRHLLGTAAGDRQRDGSGKVGA